MLLPKKFDNNFAGLIPSVLQFIFTWLRYPNIGNLLLNIEIPEKEDFDKIFENELLYPAYTVAWNVSNFFNSTGKIDIRSNLKEPLKKIRQSILRAKTLKGQKLLLVSIDHFPFSSGGLPVLETNNGFIDNEENTLINLRPGLEGVLNFSNKAKQEFGKNGKDFIAIIHELYKNTYEWARTDFNNVSIDPSVRGVLVKFNKKRRASFVSEYKFHKGLRTYFESQILTENNQQELYFIEISVFDSGAGFVKKYNSPLKESLSDIEVIQRYLMLHYTSAKGLNKNDKGFGLDRILKTINEKGFIRIKTNKRCIYRNMISHPYKNVESGGDMEIFDWDTENNTNFTEFPDTSGTVLTILYPLSTKQA